eukprot:gene27582-34030_t
MKVEATFAGQCRTLGEATEVDTVSVTQCNPQGSISMTMNNRSLEMGKQWNRSDTFMWRDYLCNSTEKEAMTSIYFWMRTASAITKEIEWEWAQLMLEAYGTPGSNCEMYLDKNSLEHPNAPVEGTYTFPADMNHCDHAHECCFASIGISFDSSPYLK